MVLDRNTWNHSNVYKQMIISKKVQYNLPFQKTTEH